jgi:6-pyruvoyltetrahydropterin/6-carboxytetrahydropterin synthase
LALHNGLYEVKIVSDFSAAHNLRNFRGKCENLHGHNWKVEVVLRGRELDENGVLVDFREIKEATRELLQGVDHHYLNDLPFFREHNPSSENIARYLFERLALRLNTETRWLYRVSAWESADACATFMSE